MISLSPFDVSIAAALVVVVSLLSLRMQLRVGKQMLIAGIRTVIQLTLLGLVLKWTRTVTVQPTWMSFLPAQILLTPIANSNCDW